jgi:glyceraldehyde-3-phosphate dehydrogenase/erythrose-4-phosphate dehydrogenase
MPKNRSQLEKMAEKDALTDGEAIFAREDIPLVAEEAEPEMVEQRELSDEVVVGKTPISKRKKPLPKP